MKASKKNKAVSISLDEYDAGDKALGMNWPKAQPCPGGNIMGFPSMGPITGITHRKRVQFSVKGKLRTFTIVTYGAYNAMGLIGSERNGVGILDEDEKCVLLDGHRSNRHGSGYFGPSQETIDEWLRVCSMSWGEFKDFILLHPNARYSV